MALNRLRTTWRGMVARLIPSTAKEPVIMSSMRNRARIRELLPLKHPPISTMRNNHSMWDGIPHNYSISYISYYYYIEVILGG